MPWANNRLSGDLIEARFLPSPDTVQHIGAPITRDFNGSPITFRADGWFNMTKAAQHFGRRLDHFMSAPDTLEYIAALQANSPESGEYLVPQRGRYGGIWAHPSWPCSSPAGWTCGSPCGVTRLLKTS